jgi:hypothetical protein
MLQKPMEDIHGKKSEKDFKKWIEQNRVFVNLNASGE